jgi:hypothetical protein
MFVIGYGYFDKARDDRKSVSELSAGLDTGTADKVGHAERDGTSTV